MADLSNPSSNSPQRPYPSRRELRQQAQQSPSSPPTVANLDPENPTAQPHIPQVPPPTTLPQVAPIDARRRDQRSRVRQRQTMRRRSFIVIPLLLVVLITAMVLVGLYVKRNLDARGKDYEGAGTGTVRITIPQGANGSEIGDILAKADVVASSQAFYNACLAQEAACLTIQPGTYNMAKQMSSASALSVLVDSANRVDEQITVGPGLTKWQVKDQLVSVGGFSAAEVEQAFAAAPGLPAEAQGNVEGWLCTGSYLAAPGQSAQDVVAEMISRSVKRLEDNKVPRAQWQTFLTKASIVQREGSDLQKQDYAKIARVIENRLVDNPQTVGLLNMDSTVLYGLGEAAKSRRIPTAAEVEDASNPYNTYIHKGLPPSPIGAVGDYAFDAVHKPDRGNWLYFVTVDLNTGETLFADTQEEQTANTKKFEQWCKDNAPACQK